MILTPKGKADELVEKYVNLLKKTDTCLAEKCENTAMCQHNWYLCEGWLSYAKQCAFIAVDELINLDYNSLEYYGILSSTDYWNEVKKEIEQMGKKICNYCQKEISKYGCACPAQG